TENNQLLATRTAYTSDGNIEDIQLLTPEEYQGWVEWIDPRTGEIEELAGFVEDFSKRNAQINTRKKELIALWEAEHPGQS
ncbi:hypothetical protein, partial [Rothia nasimurium]|uniref:hypothetical protein n=1 Tax=Rothia nasimurium TaxID=85336 RepID=UPI001F18446B